MSTPYPAITRVNDDQLVALVQESKRRLVFLAPGTALEVAKAISERWVQLGPTAVNVILDVDPEVCRLGYN